MNAHDRTDGNERRPPSRRPAKGQRQSSRDAANSGASPLGNRALARLLGSAALEAQADRAASALESRGAGSMPAAAKAPAVPGTARPGQALDAATRAHFEAGFGQDFSNVRVHDDPGVHRQLKSAQALAFTYGDDIAFAPGAYRPLTPAGRRLLAHELAHVVQQRGGAGALPGGMPALGAAPQRPQAQTDREALLARLKTVRERLAQLRAQQDQRSDAFAGSMMKERLGESLERGTRELHKQARSDAAAGRLWGGPRAARTIQQAVSVAQSGKLVTLTVNLQIAYDGMTDAQGRKRAAADIPRIEAAIRDVWQVDIAEGEYAGIQFRMLPKVTYLPRKTPRATNAFLIQVRKPDTGPSSGDAVTGLISLAPVHLEGARVIVVAHELAHLFGFVDAYLQMLLHAKPGKKAKDREQWAVGRADAKARADLMGLIDPVLLKRLRKQDAISEQEFQRQSGPVRVWDQEASLVLRTLGVAPLPPERPTIESEDFDPDVELDRIRREGEGKLQALRAKRQRAQDSLQWLAAAEEAIRLEREEKDLVQRLAALPATP